MLFVRNALGFSSLVLITASFLVTPGVTAQDEQPAFDQVIDSLPDPVVATMELRDRWFASLPPSDSGDAFFVHDLLRWTSGNTVKVAFLGGNTSLHQEIVEATTQITDACNITLDFGLDSSTDQYRTWSESDTEYVADIRVSFDRSGNFSLIGRDSINSNIGNPNDGIGGRANQRSLNLGGFNIQKPANWQRTVRHEFLHALAFKHEHQSPAGGCDAQFRWEDDDGYQMTRDTRGMFITDPGNRRPGVYTYLSGFPNFWSRAKVNHNLRQHIAGAGTAGVFDRASIMLYRFPPLFYVSTTSSCRPQGGGENLSPGDIAGLLHLYPNDATDVAEAIAIEDAIFQAIESSTILDKGSKDAYKQIRDK